MELDAEAAVLRTDRGLGEFDLVEALGLDSTGRDGHPHFPYRWDDPVVQAYIRQWVHDHA